VAEEVKYYAIVSSGRTAQTPSGIARRRITAEGNFDEALRRDLTWQPDSAIVEWEYGDVGADLVESSEAEAGRLCEGFRQKWGEQG
jgi:hypothetical protein